MKKKYEMLRVNRDMVVFPQECLDTVHCPSMTSKTTP